MLTPSQVIELIKNSLWPAFTEEKQELDYIDRWSKWTPDDIPLPNKAGKEIKTLAEFSKTPWLKLVVTTMSQTMFVDGFASDVEYRNPGAKEYSPFNTWQDNGMERKQLPIHKAALTYGHSFVVVVDGVSPITGNLRAAIRGVSPRKMYATYADPVNDVYPEYVMEYRVLDKDNILVNLYEDNIIHGVEMTFSATDPKYVGFTTHQSPYPPVFRYVNEMDLDGRTIGEVEPYIASAARINKTAFDRLLAQHFGSWKVRTIAGMAAPDEEEEREAALLLRQSDLLISENPDTKFGTLDATPLDGLINAWKSDIEALAAVSQTPAHELTGQMVNLSAEALAAARASFAQKVGERKIYMGSTHAQMLRHVAWLEGHEDFANDVGARVTWQDTEVRSMSQAVDALGKAAQMLGVPQEALWSRIPGVTKADVDDWKEIRKDQDPADAIMDALEKDMRGRVSDGEDTEPVDE